jgi:hypothetical protein
VTSSGSDAARARLVGVPALPQQQRPLALPHIELTIRARAGSSFNTVSRPPPTTSAAFDCLSRLLRFTLWLSERVVVAIALVLAVAGGTLTLITLTPRSHDLYERDSERQADRVR